MHVAISSYHVFGSGGASASLIVDGERVTRAVAEARGWELLEEDNGFVGYVYADIPVSALRAARAVEFKRSAFPGGSVAWKLGGRSAVKRLAGVNRFRGEDPLLAAARWRLDKAFQARFAKWRSALVDWALARGLARHGGKGIEWRETFRLPDGSRGGRWTCFQPGDLAYPVPAPTR